MTLIGVHSWMTLSIQLLIMLFHPSSLAIIYILPNLFEITSCQIETFLHFDRFIFVTLLISSVRSHVTLYAYVMSLSLRSWWEILVVYVNTALVCTCFCYLLSGIERHGIVQCSAVILCKIRSTQHMNLFTWYTQVLVRSQKQCIWEPEMWLVT